MKIVCPKCKGRGYINDIAAFVFTAGLFPLFDWITGGDDADKPTKDKCPKCKGKGSIRV